ncbi:MAG: hypothetical protein ACI4UE_02570 [Candidatus Scatovivens sp.]
MVKDTNNRKNYTKPSIEYVDATEMEKILNDWGIETINERTATTEVDKVVSEAIAARNKVETKPTKKSDDRDDR